MKMINLLRGGIHQFHGTIRVKKIIQFNFKLTYAEIPLTGKQPDLFRKQAQL